MFLLASIWMDRTGGVSEAKVATGTTTVQEWQGPVLDVLRELLTEHERGGAVLSIFEKLVARNAELEQQLARHLARRNPGEGVSTAQLKLFLRDLDARAEQAKADADSELLNPATDEADKQLRDSAGADERCSMPEKPAPKPPRQPAVRRPFPGTLERVAEIIAVPEGERPCPVCGRERECIGHDKTEIAELTPATVFVRVEMREKLWCPPCEGELVRAPVGDRVVSGGRYGPTLVAQLLVDKYADGLPLHRQKERFARMGLPISVSTLADQVMWGTDLLGPLWHAAQRQVLLAAVMHVDGTGLPVLERDPQTHKKVGKGKRFGTLWGYVGGETALYLYCSTGHKTGQAEGDVGPEDFLARRTGYTVADAAGLFDASFKRDGIIECGCNMHGRRYFCKALDGGDERAALPIAAFKKLYEIEDKVRSLDDEARLEVRQRESRPVYESLLNWCRTYEAHERPSSPLYRAIQYALNHSEALTRFLTDGRIPIDNGAAERLHVRVALTRKNFLFAGSDAGGHRAAIAYTVLSCCRLAGVDPREYLAEVLPKLARGVSMAEAINLLPASWRDQRAAELPATAAVPAAAAQ